MRVLLLGATGTIGQATALALLKHGHELVCLVREKFGAQGLASSKENILLKAGATIQFGDVLNPSSLLYEEWLQQPFDVLVSCLASRNGTTKDAWAVDYRAHSQWLTLAKDKGFKHFVLLSAICVQKPKLGFQQAKLTFENELIASGMRYSIVRPTAFFKSLSGQVKRLQQGKPFLLFGDGKLTACKPISNHDLGQYMAMCLTNKHLQNVVLPIGGPGPAITPLQQGEYLFKLLGKQPRFKHVPVAMLDGIIFVLKTLGWLIPAVAVKAELAQIGRYYATESMLVWDTEKAIYDEQATPSFGEESLFSHYQQMLEGRAHVELGEHAVF